MTKVLLLAYNFSLIVHIPSKSNTFSGPTTIADLVRFVSGSPYLPHEIWIKFSDTGDVMPTAQACFNELQLPTGNTTYGQFRDNMLLGIAHQEYTLDVYP